MSEQNMNPNVNVNQGVATNAAATKPAKENFLVSGFKRVKGAVSEGWKEIKNHPVTHGICAALGVTAGGFVAYKVATSMQPVVPQMPDPVPQIPEPEPEKTEENPNPVEYVDIPQTTSAAESE